ncbi:MAG: hypothetical protein WAO95_18210 [Burkholderiales bacterium]
MFRQRYLLITTSRDDPGADDLGERIAAVLAARLPESRAMVSRAPSVERIASLMTTGQADVAVLAAGSAQALYRGHPPLAEYGPFPLRVIVAAGQYRLVCGADFPRPHGYLLAEALADNEGKPPLRVPDPDAAGIPVHPGALAFARGEPVGTPP